MRTTACAGQPAVMTAPFDAAGELTGYALCGVGVEVVCAGVGLGAGAGECVGGASVGVAGPGAGVGAWLLEAAAELVGADGEGAPPDAARDGDELGP